LARSSQRPSPGTRARWAKLICPGGTGSSFGRSILLGLELLVAADIIRTVAVTPTLTSVAVLGGIVLIRTLPSFSLELVPRQAVFALFDACAIEGGGR
jgi:predicted aconitase with swiveling domain